MKKIFKQIMVVVMALCMTGTLIPNQYKVYAESYEYTPNSRNDSYVYKTPEPEQKTKSTEEQDVRQNDDGETLSDFLQETLDNNKINIIVLFILVAALAVVVYRKDKWGKRSERKK